MTGRSKITANCIVRNEERWVWFSIASVLDHVDEVLVYDTGSTDRTVEIVRALGGPKIRLEEKGAVADKFHYTRLRQEMLERSDCDWLLTLDADEIYWRDTLQGYRDLIEAPDARYDAVVVRFYNCLGDVRHREKEEYGGYRLFGREGAWSTRLVRRSIPGLHYPAAKGYGEECLADERGTPVQERGDATLALLDRHFLHTTFLRRSSSAHADRAVPMRRTKFRREYGIPFPQGFDYPEVFQAPRPEIVPDPFEPPPLAQRAIMRARQKYRSLLWTLGRR